MRKAEQICCGVCTNREAPQPGLGCGSWLRLKIAVVYVTLNPLLKREHFFPQCRNFDFNLRRDHQKKKKIPMNFFSKFICSSILAKGEWMVAEVTII